MCIYAYVCMCISVYVGMYVCVMGDYTRICPGTASYVRIN